MSSETPDPVWSHKPLMRRVGRSPHWSWLAAVFVGVVLVAGIPSAVVGIDAEFFPQVMLASNAVGWAVAICGVLAWGWLTGRRASMLLDGEAGQTVCLGGDRDGKDRVGFGGTSAWRRGMPMPPVTWLDRMFVGGARGATSLDTLPWHRRLTVTSGRVLWTAIGLAVVLLALERMVGESFPLLLSDAGSMLFATLVVAMWPTSYAVWQIANLRSIRKGDGAG